MVTLIVSTSSDPASMGPASALLAMPGWSPTISVEGMRSYANGGARWLQHDKSIVEEDNLDSLWEELTHETVDEVIFLSKHTAVTNRPALTVHPIGVPHLKEGDVPPQGGRPGWAALPDPRMGPWIRLLRKIAESRNLIPEFELVWEGLGLGGGAAVGEWDRDADEKKVLLGIGGGHYVPRHMDIIMKENIWVGHLLSGYSLPMDDPSQSNVKDGKVIGGTWKEAIRAAFEATKMAFPGGEILAHLDHKSFKGWQKKAVTEFLEEQNINIGKPNDFKQ